MNEQIREIIEQSKCLSDGHNTGVVDLEKFAELIVRECVYMVKGFEYAIGRDGLSDAMREHFGVKE